MPKFVTRAVVLGLVWVATQTATPLGIAPAWGADHEFPVMNSIGRFFGVGYTQGGYHAAQDGRLNAISNRHPAADYRPGRLPQYPQPLYGPPRSVANSGASPALAPVPADAASRGSGTSVVSPGDTPPSDISLPNKPATPAVDASSKPAVPTKPPTPPPPWLEEYLQQSEADKQREPPRHELPLPREPLPQEPLPREQIPESSLNDLLLDAPPAEREAGSELGFSIIDSGFPVPVYQSPTPPSAAGARNRYR